MQRLRLNHGVMTLKNRQANPSGRILLEFELKVNQIKAQQCFD